MAEVKNQYLSKFYKILTRVQKPSRYLGGELNQVNKDLSQVSLRIALVFPDLYEIGMSNLGLKILYHHFNRLEGVYAERFFLPAPDFEQEMRGEDLPLLSLETKTPLSRFDIIGITLQAEVTYINVPAILDLGRVDLPVEKRSTKALPLPLIIGGGPCAYNPEPLVDFFDCFFIGEAEEALEDVCKVILKAKSTNSTRHLLLQSLAAIDGLYIPEFYDAEYDAEDAIQRLTPKYPFFKEKIRKRVVWDLNKIAFPVDPIVPFMKVTHDRISVEAARGCLQGCRYCQAGYAYRPYRERDLDAIEQMTRDSLANTGQDEVSLLSLSIRDYSQFEDLVDRISSPLCTGRARVSFPSLLPGKLSDRILDRIKSAGKPGFTLAPEAGNTRLRQVINKKITDEDLLADVERVFQAGWKHIKLYFMIGLPEETQEDIEDIIDLVKQVYRLGRRIVGRRVEVSVTLSPFVPKPFTPFQWCAQDTIEVLKRKIAPFNRLKHERNIKWRWHELEACWLEAVLARGDRRVGAVIRLAAEKGCRLDGWAEHFQPETWSEAFEETGYPIDAVISQQLSRETLLPWDHIDVGVEKEFLWEQYQKALQEQIEKACPVSGRCSKCGVCAPEVSQAVRLSREPHRIKTELDKPPQQSSPELKYRYRLTYSKTGELAWLSHFEVVKVLTIAILRAGWPVAYSQGHNPRPKIAFGPPLPVGVSGEGEYADVVLEKPLRTDDASGDLNQRLPGLVQVRNVEPIDLKAPSIQSAITMYRYRIDLSALALAVEKQHSIAEAVVALTKKCEEEGREEASVIHEITYHHPIINVSLKVHNGSTLKISDLLSQLGIYEEEMSQVLVTRVAMLCK